MSTPERGKSGSDRTVHATLGDGWEVVRYDRAGKWYVEHPPPGRERRAVSVSEAARMTTDAMLRGEARINRGLPGGGTFDRIVMGYA